MARGIQEDDAASRKLRPRIRRELHLIGADMLGDTPYLLGNDVRLPDGVEERGLPVIHMPHDRHHGWTEAELARILDFGGDLFYLLDRGHLHIEPELDGHLLDQVGVQVLVHGRHDPHLQ